MSTLPAPRSAQANSLLFAFPKGVASPVARPFLSEYSTPPFDNKCVIIIFEKVFGGGLGEGSQQGMALCEADRGLGCSSAPQAQSSGFGSDEE